MVGKQYVLIRCMADISREHLPKTYVTWYTRLLWKATRVRFR